MLKDMGFCVDVAGFRDINDLDCLVDNVYDIPFQRTPFSKLNIIASHQLKEIALNNNYDIIHFHTPVASVFGRWAVKEFRKTGTKVFYTAHGFHFFRGAPLINWLAYYPMERWIARYTDVLITINKEDYARANKSFKAGRVEYVPGVGLDIQKFSEVIIDKLAKRKEIGVPDDAFIILSVGELNKNKNHETVIKAIAKLNKPYIYYVICGVGDDEGYLKELSVSLGLRDHVKLLGYRNDVSEIYQVTNIFAFPSFREGLSVALMEAMAAGMPIICANIRGNNDLIEDRKGGYLVKSDDVEEFSNAICRLVDDKKVRLQMGLYNTEKIKMFDMGIVKTKMAQIYALT